MLQLATPACGRTNPSRDREGALPPSRLPRPTSRVTIASMRLVRAFLDRVCHNFSTVANPLPAKPYLPRVRDEIASPPPFSFTRTGVAQ